MAKLPKHPGAIKILLIAFAGTVAAIGSLLVYGGSKNIVNTVNPMEALEKLQQSALGKCTSVNSEFVGSINEFLSEYSSNPIAFDQKYKEKCVSIDGAPTELSTTTGYTVTLSPYVRQKHNNPGPYSYESRTSGMQVLASFSRENAEELGNVKVNGDLIRLTGRVSGILDNIYVGLDGSTIDGSFKNSLEQQLAHERVEFRSEVKDQVLSTSLGDCTQNCTGPYNIRSASYVANGLDARVLEIIQSIWREVDPTKECKIVSMRTEGTYGQHAKLPDYGCGHDDGIERFKQSAVVNQSNDSQLGQQVPFESLGRQ